MTQQSHLFSHNLRAIQGMEEWPARPRSIIMIKVRLAVGGFTPLSAAVGWIWQIDQEMVQGQVLTMDKV